MHGLNMKFENMYIYKIRNFSDQNFLLWIY